MRILTCVLLLSVETWLVNAFDAGSWTIKRDSGEDRRVYEIPECVTTCAEQITQMNDCGSGSTQCFCSIDNTPATIDACLMANCTGADSLVARRYQAEICDYPIRDRGPLTRRLNWAMFTIATLFIFGRFFSRAPSLGGSGYGWDDWMALFCYTLLIPTDVSSEYEVRNGLGLDIYMASSQLVSLLKWFYVGELLYNIIVMWTKLSLVLLYLRIWTADSNTKAFRTICWILVAVLNGTWIAGVFVIAFQCSPVSYTWTRPTGMTQGTCIDIEAFTYTYGALNILYDIIVILLAVHSLLKLNKPWPQKLGISSVFLVGFLVTICSIVRLQYLVQIGSSSNITWNFQYIGMWSLVEANFSLVCCCMPAMAGLLQRIWLKYFDRERAVRAHLRQQNRMYGSVDAGSEKGSVV